MRLDPWIVGHDFAFHFGGAERVTGALSRMMPLSPVAVLAGDNDVLRQMNLQGDLTKLFPHGVNDWNHRALAPLYPRVLARRPPIEANLLASSYAFSHMIPVEGRTVVYCHSPLRQIWSGVETYKAGMSRAGSALWNRAAGSLRERDRAAAANATSYVATSRAVRARIEAYYGRQDVPIIQPPMNTAAFYPDPAGARQAYFLWAGRIVEPYKRLSLVIEVFRNRSEELLVAGDGRDRAKLERDAPSNVRFLGAVDSEMLGNLYRGAAALIFPSEDDFGMVPAESISCGTPVVAYGAGGALDTVVEGASGVFFTEPKVADLDAAISRFQAQRWPMAQVLAASKGLSELEFQGRMKDLLLSL